MVFKTKFVQFPPEFPDAIVLENLAADYKWADFLVITPEIEASYA